MCRAACAGRAECARLLKESPGAVQDLGPRAAFHCCGSSGFRAICNRADEGESFIGKCLFEKNWLRGSEK